jgi:pimeloyl-ACP methyl ester carboxylesterase
MPSPKPHTTRSYITPLNMNKLRGRMLIMPKLKPQANTEFLLVYGQKSTLEKWGVLASELRNYGNVTMPDLPGIGGMQSFYRINEKPTTDNYADYLAAFIKLRYRRKKIVIIGMSFGFIVVTRMLQKFPDLIEKVELIINLSGFAHNENLKLTIRQKKEIRLYTKLFSTKYASRLYRGIFYDEFVYRYIYKYRHKESRSLSHSEFRKVMKKELTLQKKNDTRTHMYILHSVFKLDNTLIPIDKPVWSIVGSYDEYLDADSVKRSLEIIFSKYHEIKLKSKTHKLNNSELTPEYIANAIPYKLKVLLNRQNRKVNKP